MDRVDIIGGFVPEMDGPGLCRVSKPSIYSGSFPLLSRGRGNTFERFIILSAVDPVEDLLVPESM